MCNFLCLYRSPIQTWEIVEAFADNLELTLDTLINENPFLIVAVGDFNTKTTNWYENNTTSYEDLKTCYYIPVWFASINQWTNSSNSKLFFVYWFNFYFSVKPCYGVMCSFFSSSKLSSSDIVGKILSKKFLCTTLRTLNLALQ